MSPIRTRQSIPPHPKPTLTQMAEVQAGFRAIAAKAPKVYRDRETAFAVAMAKADAELAGGALDRVVVVGAQAKRAAA